MKFMLLQVPIAVSLQFRREKGTVSWICANMFLLGVIAIDHIPNPLQSNSEFLAYFKKCKFLWTKLRIL
jgi:hypothetical protein